MDQKQSLIDKIVDKTEKDGDQYMANVLLTLEINALEKAYLKSEDNLPLFYKQFDELGVLVDFSRNAAHKSCAILPSQFDISSVDALEFLDKVEADLAYYQKLEVFMFINGLEQLIAQRIDENGIIRQRFIERIYEGDSELPTTYRLHSSADRDFIKSQFPEIDADNLLSIANN